MVSTPEGLGLRVRGVVQGVGFRPFVYRLATRLGLSGYVKNTGEGVFIAVFGEPEKVKLFVEALRKEAPPLARIDAIEALPLTEPPPPLFTVLESTKGKCQSAHIPPDVATCKACLSELFDPSDRRYRYPFINCTDCGPRFTVIEGLPYDREKTTMRKFAMCPDCLAEYTNPLNRRFHAEPNACPVCGPRVWVTDRAGRKIETQDPLALVIKALKEGKIVALKGLGGFHLACDATNERACQTLRERKRRPAKPLAVMVPDLERAREVACLSPEEEELLASARSPILLARKKRPFPLAERVAPGLEIIGLMLPYTPLHHLILKEGAFLALVMTSGNLSGEPLCYENHEALKKLSPIADLFLLHDRDIVVGIDDSVVRVVEKRPLLVRRARGYVPEALPFPCEKSVISFGPHLKNTFTLTRPGEAFVSQHLGDLENLETVSFALKVRQHFEKLLGTEAELAACDLHPDYLSTFLARTYASERNRPLLPVQHHLAHAVAVAGEHRLDPPFLGLILDGLGLGSERELWGGELLLVKRNSFERVGHLVPVPQPGGDAATKKPWRMFLSYFRAGGLGGLKEALAFLPKGLASEAKFVWQMLEKGLNCPLTTSLGRFFDACAAALGLCYENTFEGQAPMVLESAALRASQRMVWEPALNGLKFDLRPLFAKLVRLVTKETTENLACAVHLTLVKGFKELVSAAAQKYRLTKVVLGGGCFQNLILTTALKRELEEAGLEVYLPRNLPPNDGGLSYGQALWAAWQAEDGRA